MRPAFNQRTSTPRGISIPALFIVPNLLLTGGEASAANVTLSWDPVAGIAGYKLYYGTASRSYGSTPVKIAAPTTTATVPALSPGQTYYFAVTDYDASGNESTYSNEISVPIPGAAASFSVTPASGIGTTATVFKFTDTTSGDIAKRQWKLGDSTTASGLSVSKNYGTPGSYNVTLSTTDTSGYTSTATHAITVADQPVADFSAAPTSGTGSLTVRFTDASEGATTGWLWQFGDGATSAEQNPTHTYLTGNYTVTLKVTGPGGTSAPTSKTGYIKVAAPATGGGNANGLVAAYGFNEADGATVVDASGAGNHGVITGGTRSGSGRFGGALHFDGASDWVTVNDSPSLDLATGMTLEAWVYPTAAMSGTKSVIVKEDGGGRVYWLRANNYGGLPEGGLRQAGVSQRIVGTDPLPPNAWSHLAVTYDGGQESLYLNGALVGSQSLSGPIATSTGALRIGGASGTSGYFQGYLDEVRIYNRALSPAEITRDSKTAINSPSAQVLVGENGVGTVIDSDAQGVAEAYQSVAQKTGTIAQLQVYLDAGSTAAEVVAGVYADDGGHPGSLLAQGVLKSPEAGAWNAITIPSTRITAGTAYWIALLGAKGNIAFRVADGPVPMESCATTGLTALPANWATGTVWREGKMSVYGPGF